jgi:hypothetical protein
VRRDGENPAACTTVPDPGSAHPQGGLGRRERERAYALGPSHPVHLTRFIADDIANPTPVHPPRGRPAPARTAAAGKAGIGIPGCRARERR